MKLKNFISSFEHWLVFKKSKALEFTAPLRRVLKARRSCIEVEVITMMYNEAFLAPLFVRHYASWVDKITIFYNASVDGTREELEKAAVQCGVKSLNIVPYEFPEGFDDLLKIERINQAVRESSADFVVCVDADEFVHPWPFEGSSPRIELLKEKGNVVYCAMYQSYRHVTEKDIDRTKPPLFQRRYGSLDIEWNIKGLYTKPCIVRPDCGAQFMLGCHHLIVPKKGSTAWRGVHWAKADNFCILRCTRDRRDRFSQENRRHGRSANLFDVTEESIAAELKAHENDPQLF